MKNNWSTKARVWYALCIFGAILSIILSLVIAAEFDDASSVIPFLSGVAQLIIYIRLRKKNTRDALVPVYVLCGINIVLNLLTGGIETALSPIIHAALSYFCFKDDLKDENAAVVESGFSA